jgi:transposase
MPHRAFVEAARADKPDGTLQDLCNRLWSERSVKADTSMMSRFLRRIGVTLKKRRSLRVNRTVRT